MAQYEASEEQVQQLTSSEGLSASTKAAIESVAKGGGTVAMLGSEGSTKESVSGSVTDQAVAAANVDLNNLTLSDAVAFVASSGTTGDVQSNSSSALTAEINDSNVNLTVNNDANNNISFGGSQGAAGSATLGNGDNTVNIGGEGTSGGGVTVNTGNGNNTFNIGNANTDKPFDVSVNTGDGNDTMNVEGTVRGEINTGDGNLELTMDASAQQTAEISVNAGEGFDLLKLLGQTAKHLFEFVNGKFHMHSADVSMTGVNVVATDVNSDGQISQGTDHITILAETEEDSLIAKLYKVALGREAIDGNDGWGDSTLGGFNWWTNEYEKTNDINDHEQLVRAFLNCDEFHNKYDSMTDAQYVNALFTNLGVSDSEAVQNYINQLANGSLDREEVAWQVATSETAVKVLGNDGEQYVIDGDFSANA